MHMVRKAKAYTGHDDQSHKHIDGHPMDSRKHLKSTQSYDQITFYNGTSTDPYVTIW